MTVATKPMADHIRTFVQLVRGRDSTRATYTTILKAFERFAGPRGINSKAVGIEFVTRARCARTRNLYLTAIDGYRRSRSLPVLGLRAEKPQKHVFNPARIAEVFDAMLPLCRVERDRAILAILRYGGLRISEAITLRAQDITFPNAQLQIGITQSKSETRDPIAWRATKILRDYLDRVRLQGRDWLFPSTPGEHVAKRTVEAMVSDLSTRCGYRITPHDFRRLCATEMGGKFGGAVLCDYFGWERLATAEVYIQKARGSSTAAILDELGIQKTSTLFTTEKCWRCGSTNAPNQVHCGTCGELLDPSAIPHKEAIDKLDEQGLEALLLRILHKRGILK